MSGARLGIFTRLLDAGTDGERYHRALAQVRAAEQHGFASLWVAQHHFDRDEGGLPSPFPFLAAAAVQTERIALGTGIVTLPIDDPIRVAEDAAVVNALSGGRVQLGIGTGGTPSSFAAFRRSSDDRRAIQAEHVEVLRDAFGGRGIRGTSSVLNPPAPDLAVRLWQATFSVEGGRRAGLDGDGLLLSRTQPKDPGQTLHDVQLPIVEAYLEALPSGVAPRILASRTAVVVDAADLDAAWEAADPGLRRLARTFLKRDGAGDLRDVARITDTHLGTVDEVVASLGADLTLGRATDVAFQVHSVDPAHEITLRSIELLATEVAPRLGLRTGAEAAVELRNLTAQTTPA
ncbi:putative FMN-dependent luciferase-like monooxygenase [Microbacterium sp. Kw_RZR3]|jgi:putative FMN-dependent luciferase-like monooxygenase|uniref:putative FMN-dependent luciferase-like monooxygenase n=1 Tax=Microbacterium sp. Kw_RZR3 TaxID=3032903 RepID=UPI0023DB41F5|nr:putative FMN-dependent luciferase-like monooxygenase [Microbacterium sp. Kw_RZR3]MDF2044664.1 putative FMN-dependent luciferase-like monooxygenase [Microbacterium sp. Kw_RZR3]